MNSIPYAWPSAGLQAIIEASRPCFNGKRVLVTGAFGFVGGHLARALHAAGAHVTALDNDTSRERGALLNLTGLRDALQVIEADVAERRAMQEIIAKGNYDFIFHFALETPHQDGRQPYDVIRAYTLSFIHIAEAVRQLPMEKRPVILLASSDKIYGGVDAQDGEAAGDGEALPWGNLAVEQSAQLAAEFFAITYHRTLGVPTIVLRRCNLFGPYDFNYGHLIPKALRNIFRDGEAPDLYISATDHYRDYLYVEDAVRAFMHLAQREACRGHAYNLPGARYAATPDVLRDLIDLIILLQSEAGENEPTSSFARLRWNRTVRIVKSDSRPTVVHKPRTDGTRLEREADFEPSVTFRDALRHTVHYYYWYFTHIAPGPKQQESSHHAESTAPTQSTTITPLVPSDAIEQQPEEIASPPAPAANPLYQVLRPRQQVPAPPPEVENEEDSPPGDTPHSLAPRPAFITVYKLEKSHEPGA